MTLYTSVIILTLLALAVLTILIYENHRIPLEKKRLFVATNIIISLSAIAECGGVHIEGNASIPHWVLSMVKAFDYSLTPLSGAGLILLMAQPKMKKFVIAIGCLFAVNILMQTICAFTSWMTVIDENNHYVHGIMYPFYIVFYSLVIVFLAVELVFYGKSFKKQNRVSLYATFSLIFIGIAMQEFLPSTPRIAYIALTFGSAYLYIHCTEFKQMRMDDTIQEQEVKISIDTLTGAYSRFAYVEALKTYAINTPDNFVVYVIDINGLKTVNDSFGHEAGDELICGAADCISQTLGKGTKTYRIGGDEFVVFASMTNDQSIEALSELEYATKIWRGKKVKHLSVSVGYAFAKDYTDYTIEDLAIQADKSMYEQKNAYYQRNGIYR